MSRAYAGEFDGPFGPPKESPPALEAISDSVLEIHWVSRAEKPEATFSSPDPSAIKVTSGTEVIPVKATGVRRRALYAPFKTPNLLNGNSIYIQLTKDLPDGASVQANLSASGTGLKNALNLQTTLKPDRLSRVLHVNQTGYLPEERKSAYVGFFLGTLGEMDVGARSFSVLGTNGLAVYHGKLSARADEGFPYAAYQRVMEADFSAFKTPGVYRVAVQGLGVSYPFRIGDEPAAALARTYALGLYHQRCGMDNSLPFTRFTHGPCHVRPASVPDTSPAHENANWTLQTENQNSPTDARRKSAKVTTVARSLYAFANRGSVGARGGHHDAGDYSKYTINSAAFVHLLLTACDAFPGAAALDNLGVPESGDGKSDLLQEAKWESDFLASMQDSDGGFFFLVYPQGRRYESDVTPDRGDPQVVFPKNTAGTAAAVAALAQCASSPLFKSQFPEAVPVYLDKARKGWAFLQQAIQKHGKDAAYQRITHYGDEFMHDDEIAWAAVELFLATGEPAYADAVKEWFRPADAELKKWGWWRLFDAQGCAIRSYGLAVHTKRVTPERLDATLLRDAQQEILAAGDDQMTRSKQSAYGTSFPAETKRAYSAGWYFSPDAAFDLAVASQLQPGGAPSRKEYRDAIVANFNYEQGANPISVSYLTGIGWNRQFEIVHQFAQNDRRVLPPIGIPLGNIQGGISWIDAYKDIPGKFSVPPDEGDAPGAPYPFYDRWTDGFNLSQEFVILNQARALGVAAWLMAQTSLKTQAWKAAPAVITGLPRLVKAGETIRLKLAAPGLDLSQATIIWEGAQLQPQRSAEVAWPLAKPGPAWIEAEAQLPDGRRVFAAAEVNVSR